MPNDPPETPEPEKSADTVAEDDIAGDQSNSSGMSSYPTTGRLAAIDYGTKRIGIAVCDPDRILASPVEVYQVRDPASDGKYFNDFARHERLVGWVVGLPIHNDGGESQKSEEARAFARWLTQRTRLPVRLFDERFTTAAAKERLAAGRISRQKKKQRLDAVAALVILESFLEACRYRGQIVGQSTSEPVDGEPLSDGASLSDGKPLPDSEPPA